jgi:hypothetical protein
MKIKNVSFTILFTAFLLLAARNLTQAAVAAGTYSVISLGTAGSHATEPGGKGTMTVYSSGKISGSLYSYEDRTSTRFSGTISLKNGVGTLIADGKVIRIAAISRTATVITLSYEITTSTSKGLVWGYK